MVFKFEEFGWGVGEYFGKNGKKWAKLKVKWNCCGFEHNYCESKVKIFIILTLYFL